MARKPAGDLNLAVQVEAFNRCLREMEQKLATTASMQQIVDYEVGRIVNMAIRKTERATIRSIRKSNAERPPWRTYDLGRGMKRYYLENRYPNAVWRQIQQRIEQSLALKFQARELARRVWVEILNKLGQGVEASQQARQAQSGNFVPSSAASVDRTASQGKYGVAIENSYGKNQWSNSAQALFGAIAGRRRYFLANVSKGVFSSLESIAKRYPGITVTY